MGKFPRGCILPMLLLTAALLNWSLISLVDLLAFLLLQYASLKHGSGSTRQPVIPWHILIFSCLTILSHAIFQIVLAVRGVDARTMDAQWAKLVGFTRGHSGWHLPTGYFLVMQVLTAIVASVEIYGNKCGMGSIYRDSSLRHMCSPPAETGSHLRIVCCLLLPVVQLVAGISHPSWISLPFFICSSVGLVDWSSTCNFLGLFRWWRYLLLYAGANIVLLYIYQLPVEFPETVIMVSKFFGFFKISSTSDTSEICSVVSLLVFYVMLSSVRSDLDEMDSILSTRESDLTEPLLQPKHSFFIHQSRSGIRHSNVLLRGPVFRIFSINYFVYGFPVSLLAISFWSFHFASLSAFTLLVYVEYILFSFHSMFHLHRLNVMLLVFILLWTASTYVFNVAFAVSNSNLWKLRGIWETIGLWHYTTAAYYLLAQFGVGILVAMGNLVSNSVFSYLSDGELLPTTDDSAVEVSDETNMIFVTTVAWGLRRSSRTITLVLILFVAMKPGLIHALYMVFFLIYLFSHKISSRLRQSMVLLCEVHLALLYILQLHLISKYLQQKGAFAVEILSQLGLINHIGPMDFLKIAALACFCAIQNHGLQTLSSFSAILQQTPYPPIGCSNLRAATLRSIILCACSAKHREGQTVHDERTASYLESMGNNFVSTYRSLGTPIMFLAILLSVYLVTPNYASLGYLVFLVLWMSRRQLIGESERRYWLPMKVYAATVFVSIYSMDVFPSLHIWLSRFLDMQSAFGYKPEATMLDNIWVSLAVLVLMQLYTYARRESKRSGSSNCVKSRSGALAFVRRILIWHSEKILSIALFYASLSPIGAFGFLYLLGLVICAMLPKFSSIPSKLFISYSGFLIMFEYLFQLWGDHAAMFPGQEHAQVSLFLGLRAYEPGFFGLESGLRGKVLVAVACILQYNVFHWLEKMPRNDGEKGKWEEPCSLFTFAEDETIICSKDNTRPKDVSAPLIKKDGRCHSWPRINTNLPQGRGTLSEIEGYERDGSKKYLNFNFWESSNDSLKWNRKRILFLRRERLEMQKVILKLSMKFGLENMFNLFGLEINMIALLLGSFSVLNVISLLYIASVAACALLHRHVIKKLWPVFVFLFACVVTFEYVAMWINLTSWNQSMQHIQAQVPCHECWRATAVYFRYCKKCWLGVVADDPRVLISYYAVFMLSCFKLRADRLSIFSESEIYKRIRSRWKHVSDMIDLPFETKGLWTLLDYLKLYSYCHLLDLVLTLILMTGTLEFDILHLGYLGFALAFIRMRLEILKKRNKIFRFLRIYNFALIVLSLAYQSPFVAYPGEAKHDSMQNISEVIGFYKYDYGFRITSRSSLVEIVIFILVSLQSYMFSSQQFDYVSKYLETEQIGAILREQEKKAAWKTAQLQHMRKSEEEKRLRDIQVEKIKFEMLTLQRRLYNNTSTVVNHNNASVETEGQRKTKNIPRPFQRVRSLPHKVESESDLKKGEFSRSESMFHISSNEWPPSDRAGLPLATDFRKHPVDSLHGITELEKRASSNVSLDLVSCNQTQHPLRSAVHLLGDGVSQLKSLGNKTVNNLVRLLKLEREKPDTDDYSSDDEVYYEIEDQNIGIEHLEPTYSTQSVTERNMSDSICAKIGIIIRYIWSQVRSNNDVVCYCCFILIYVWNFSLFSTFYLAALFLYAVCVNTGPNHIFWIVVLIYTEMCILLQYIYQIIIQHCDWNMDVSFLQELGFPADKIMSSFVTSNLPLFLVYLCTLLQTSITARDGDWAIAADFRFHKRRIRKHEKDENNLSFVEKLKGYYVRLRKIIEQLVGSLHRYWKSLIEGSETPPYFLQLSMEVNPWPEDGIQPHTIESGINKLLKILNNRRCKERNLTHLSPSRVRVQSIEKSAENETVGLAVFDVLHASPSTESGSGEGYSSLTPAADVANEIRRAHFAGDFKEIKFPYPILSIVGGGKREIDLYAYIFCADLAVFFLVAIFYHSVIKNNSEFLEVYQLEDQFPKEFVFVLMVVFFLIVLDRIIYLCSFAIGKVIFYTFNLILFTSSVTRYAWGIDISHRHSGKFALRAIFLTKAISLALQAVQIRFGIPQKSTLYRQFLTSSISKFYYFGFRLYRALPFLYELRCVLDWSCTTTSLTMHDWLKLEDIHASLFLVKCDVELNKAWHQQGQRQSKMTKFCNGICLFFVLICVIWAPMLMYSSGNPTNIANPIKDATAKVDIKSVGGRLTLFETSLCEKISWQELDAHENLDPHGFLSSYNEEDIQLICCQADASTLWLVPPVVQARFMESIRWTMYISFAWQFTRDRPKGKEVVKYELDIQDQDLPTTSDVIKVLNGTSNSFRINNVYPRYFRVTGSGEVRLLEHMVDPVNGDLVLNRGHPEWWSFHDFDRIHVRRCGELPGPMAIVVSEETPQGILGETLSKFSIWGLYITFVLAVGRFIRLQCADLRMRIPFENLPSCDRLLAICEDIYTARAEGELEVEEALYWMLVNIYRSPHLLLEYTRPN